MINPQFIAMLYGTEVSSFLRGCACIIFTTFELTPTFRIYFKNIIIHEFSTQSVNIYYYVNFANLVLIF